MENHQSQGGYAPPRGRYSPTPQGRYSPTPQGGYPQPQGGYAAPQGNYLSSPGNPSAALPIATQPVSQGDNPTSTWMRIPQNVPNCPPGLEYLSMIDQLIVNREPDLEEPIGWVGKASYVITNNRDEQVYCALEVSECCSRNWCGSSRPFEMKIFDNFGNEVISMNRPLACQRCCCPCCLQSIEISAPPGTIVAVIEQQWSIWYPTFVIKNSAGDVALRIKGPCCGSACCADVNFRILSADGDTELGKLYKMFLGCGNQQFNNEHVFGVEFPMDLDVRMKSTMLGACFLIEMMYFEVAGAGNIRTARHFPAVGYRHHRRNYVYNRH